MKKDLPFELVFYDATRFAKKIPQSDYLSKGYYPILDQGKKYISGYYNDNSGLFSDVPAIIFGDHTRIIKFITSPCFIGADGVKLLKFKTKDDPKYLYYALQSLKIPNTGYNRHFRFLKEAKIRIWPKNIQEEIVLILDNIKSIIEKKNRQIENIDMIAKSRFIEMFGDPISNSKNLETKKGEELFSFSSGKFNPSKNLTCSNPYPCYGGNGITGYSKDFILETPTVVIGRVGAYCGSVHITKPKSWITDNAIYLKQYNKKDYRLLFIYFLFLFFKFNRFSSASGQPKITQKPLEQSNFILPTIDLQDIFVNFIEQLDKSKFRIKKSLEKLEMTYKALLQEYFG